MKHVTRLCDDMPMPSDHLEIIVVEVRGHLRRRRIIGSRRPIATGQWRHAAAIGTNNSKWSLSASHFAIRPMINKCTHGYALKKHGQTTHMVDMIMRRQNIIDAAEAKLVSHGHNSFGA